MTIQSQQLDELLVKLKLVDPLPLNIQKYIRRTKSREFKTTLKKAGGYSLLFGIISFIFFLLRRFRISITIVNSAILLAVGSLFLLGALAAAIYLSMKDEIIPLEQILKTSMGLSGKVIPKKEHGASSYKRTNEKVTAKEDSEPGEIKEDFADIEGRLGIKLFKEEIGDQEGRINISEGVSEVVTDKIAENLSVLRGNTRVIDFRLEKSDKRVGMMLFGSVEFLEGNFIIHARIVKVNNRKIIYYTSETINSRDEVDAACSAISKRIYLKIK